MRYETQAKKDSMYNTPNTFGIWLVGLVADWVLSMGGLTAMAQRNQEKADLLYETLDGLDAFVPVVRPQDRSLMNVTFRMTDTSREAELLEEAARRDIVGIRGHRSVGGLRASIYNAVEFESVSELCQLLRDMN